MSRRGLAFGAIGAAVVAVATTVVVAWWAIGDLTETDPTGADYLWRPPHISRSTTSVLVATSAVLLLVSLAVLVVAWRRLRPPIEWALLLGLWLGAAIGIAVAERTVTAGVIGANIGGGLVVLASPFAALGLIGFSAILIWQLRRDRAARATR